MNKFSIRLYSCGLLFDENNICISDSSNILSEFSINALPIKLLKLRKSEEYKEVFVYGKFESLLTEIEGVFVYTRETNDKKVCVVTNMIKDKKMITLPFEIKKVLLNNYQKEYKGNVLEMDAFETIVFEI